MSGLGYSTGHTQSRLPLARRNNICHVFGVTVFRANTSHRMDRFSSAALFSTTQGLGICFSRLFLASSEFYHIWYCLYLYALLGLCSKVLFENCANDSADPRRFSKCCLLFSRIKNVCAFTDARNTGLAFQRQVLERDEALSEAKGLIAVAELALIGTRAIGFFVVFFIELHSLHRIIQNFNRSSFLKWLWVQIGVIA